MAGAQQICVAGCLSCLVAGMILGRAAEPSFYLIEPYLKLGVLIHFDVDAFRTYELQCTTNLAAASGDSTAPTNAWRTIYRVDPTPFSNHYILPEFFTNTTAQQFYRLVVTP